MFDWVEEIESELEESIIEVVTGIHEEIRKLGHILKR